MRLVIRVGFVVGLALFAVVPPPPAQAAQSGTIRASAVPGLGVTRNHWSTLNSCSTAALAVVNGIDGAVFDVGGRPTGSTVSIRWSGVMAPTPGTLTAQLFNASCRPVGTSIGGTTTGTGVASGTATVPIPTPVKWLLIEGVGVANVTLTMP